MSEEIVYEQFDQGPAPQTGSGENDLQRLSDVPMELSVEIGRTSMTVGETLGLRAGSIVTLDRLSGEPVDLLVNGTPIARGEVVVVDEQFGLRVTQILEGEAPGAVAGDAGAAAPTEAQAADDQPLAVDSASVAT